MFAPLTKTLFSGLYSCGMIQLHTILHVKVGEIVQSLIKFCGIKRRANKSLPQLEPFTVISKNSCVVLGCNAGPHTLQGTNTYLIGTDNGFKGDGNTSLNSTSCKGKMLIDTGELSTSDDYIKVLLDEVFPATNTTHLTHILLTHYHHDHIGGVEPLLSALAERKLLPLPVVYKRQCVGYPAADASEEPAPHAAAADSSWLPIDHRQVFRVTGDDSSTVTTVVALHTPGHTADHVSFVIEEDRALCSGDCILGCSSSVFDNLSVYMSTLARLKFVVLKGVTAFDGEGTGDGDGDAVSCIPCGTNTADVSDEVVIRHIYPGHGPILKDSALQTVNEYIHHRELRERQIVTAMRKHAAGAPPGLGFLSSWHIMRLIYTKPFPFVLKMAAQHNVLKHLAKLQTDGVVENSRRVSVSPSVAGAGLLSADLDLWCIVE